MGFFKKARDMYALQKQSKDIKKELKNTHIEAEVDGITVVINGEQEVLSVSISDTVWGEIQNHPHGKAKIADAFAKATNKALKKAQEIASGKMKGIWNQLGVAQ